MVTILTHELGWSSLLGLADSSYQTYTHYSGTGLLGCSSSGDACVLVQHSAESIVFGS